MIPVERSPRSSGIQEQFLQLWQQDPGSAAYNTPWGVLLGGSLDMRALQSAVRLLALRHLVRPWPAVVYFIGRLAIRT